MTNTKFKPTPEMLSACRAVLMAKAFVRTIRPIVEKITKDVFAENKFPCGGESYNRLKNRGATDLPDFVTSEDDLYYLSEDECARYIDLKHQAVLKAGLTVEEKGQCPLLVAEELERKATNELLEVMSPITKLKVDRIPYTKKNELVELILRLLTPFVGDAKTILAEK